eukprot:6580138-Ditylum_brightwellii.AAC.1
MDSNVPSGASKQSADEAAEFLANAVKQMNEWEEAVKGRAKEQEEAEKEISEALDKLTEVTKKMEESGVAGKNAKLFQRTTEMQNKASELEEW